MILQASFETWEEAATNTGECFSIQYEKSCDLYESFGPKQSSNNVFTPKPRSYCADFYGGKIFGDASFDEAEDSTCACSRKYWELTQFALANSVEGTPRSCDFSRRIGF